MGKPSVHWLLLELHMITLFLAETLQPDHMGNCYTGSNDTGQIRGKSTQKAIVVFKALGLPN